MRPVGVSQALAKAAPRELVRGLSGRDEPVGVAPDYLRWLYKTYAYVPRAVTRNALGIVGFVDEFPSPRDLGLFMSLFRRDAQPVTYAVALVNDGRYNRDQPGSEANQNMQYTEAISYPTPNIFYSTGGSSLMWGDLDGKPVPGDLFLGWAHDVLSQVYIPQTISMSYGLFESIVPAEYAHSVCKLFALIAVRGVSVLVSSGNFGVGEGECKDNSGRVQFMPRFPASCMCDVSSPFAMRYTSVGTSRLRHCYGFAGPWLTSVGGTTSAHPEVAAFLSGGGFSNYFPIPLYQSVAVPDFLRNIRSQYRGLYKFVICPKPFILSDLVIFEALPAADSPTSPRRRSTSRWSTIPFSWL